MKKLNMYVKKLFSYIAQSWKEKPIEFFRMILEIVIVFGLVPYLTYKQTDISTRQLELQERQQNISEQQMAIFQFEHRPRFQIEEYSQKNSSGDCMRDEIYIKNEGYSIDTKEITVYSFFEISNEEGIKTIFPVQFYYATGTVTRNATGVLEAYTSTNNHAFYTQLRDQLSSIAETYYWQLDQFHIVKIEWSDILGEDHVDFFTTQQFQPNQKMSISEANKYIALHNSDFYIDIQKPLDINAIIEKVKTIDYNKSLFL